MFKHLFSDQRSPPITDDYSVHQLSHNALLVLYQRPWTITNISSNIIGALRKPNTATCQQVRNTGKNPSVVLSTLANGLYVILLVSLLVSVSWAVGCVCKVFACLLGS